ncbi:MAG: hypothetical protein KDK97_24445 [Verrucomicrobiales bacterium]|nr:hypothetical protein [Verrucomicrobiales bacterium]MCP5558889.1 hypothetical protein [Verrucomicrobiaceae bacterium]
MNRVGAKRSAAIVNAISIAATGRRRAVGWRHYDGVTNLGLIPSDPPTQNDVQQVIDKLDEVINALRR